MKNVNLTVRITPEDADALRQAAAIMKCSMGELVRRLLVPSARAIVTGRDEDIRRAAESTGVVMTSRRREYDELQRLAGLSEVKS